MEGLDALERGGQADICFGEPVAQGALAGDRRLAIGYPRALPCTPGDQARDDQADAGRDYQLAPKLGRKGDALAGEQRAHHGAISMAAARS